MRLIDADVLDSILADGEKNARKSRKYVLESAINTIRGNLAKMPTIEVRKWIPCTERLPEDGQNVLVTYKTTDKIHPCQYHDDGSRNPWYSYLDNCRAYSNVVIAWMPLPEPYKGGRA